MGLQPRTTSSPGRLRSEAVAHEVEGGADEDERGGEQEFALEVGAADEDVAEAGDGQQRRQRVEPEAEGARHLRPGTAEVKDADVLEQKLDDDAKDDEGGDDVGEREEAEDDGGRAEDEEGDVREAAGLRAFRAGLLAQVREGPEEVAIAGRGVGDAGVAEQQREDAGEGGNHDQHGGDAS